MTAKKKLEESGLKVSSAKLVVEPTTTVSIAEKPAAEQILKLIDTLEEDDDVDSVSANFDILDDLMKELE